MVVNVSSPRSPTMKRTGWRSTPGGGPAGGLQQRSDLFGGQHRRRRRTRGGSTGRRGPDGSGPLVSGDRSVTVPATLPAAVAGPRPKSLREPLILERSRECALVVQKYGGSSVSDADRIRRVAERIVETKKQGNDVVVVVSAMGDTTDDLLDLAKQVCPSPPPREMDMLLTAGERISNALVAMAIESLGAQARSFTGSQAGVITTGIHGNAKIIDVTPGPVALGARRGPDRAGRRIPGGQPGHQGRHHTGPRRLRHHRRGAGRRARRRRLRDLHRRRRDLHRRSAHRAQRAPARQGQLRGDARDGRVRRQGADAALRGIRPPLQRADSRALVVLGQARHHGHRIDGGHTPWKTPS